MLTISLGTKVAKARAGCKVTTVVAKKIAKNVDVIVADHRLDIAINRIAFTRANAGTAL
jgi:hypothetical protein